MSEIVEKIKIAEKAPGFRSYIPSRLEWLAFALNSLTPYFNSSLGEEINQAYMPKYDGKTLILIVSYPKDLDSKKLEEHIENMKEHVRKFAEANNWDSWIEIEVEHKPE